MSFAFGAMVILLPLLAVLVGIPVYIGTYVYRDARRRGMNPLLWTLIAVLAPTFTGFILYLLIRGNHGVMACPQCGGAVGPEYVLCPNCGARLRHACPRCGHPAEADWTLCPYCGESLPKGEQTVTPPERFRDRGLGRILAAAVVAPVLLALLVGIFSVSSFTGGGSSSMARLTVQEYQDAAGIEEDAQALLDSVRRNDQAYVLRYVEQSIDTGRRSAQYLVYVPQMGEDDSVSFGRSNGLFGSTLAVEITASSAGNGGNTLILLTSGGDRLPKLRIDYGGKRLSCVVDDVDHPLVPEGWH